MTITAKIIEDSVSPDGKRLTTMQLCYPRFIHAEFMTHRLFSRNASSSRAIPVKKMIQMVRDEPAMPIHWGANQPGMQASAEIQHVEVAKDIWLRAARNAANIAEEMEQIGLHKQVANRILEPFQHIHVIVTATEWENFFALRAHPDAQPEIHELALQMQLAMQMSEPAELKYSDWHLPYVTRAERKDVDLQRLRMLPKISAARCARVSYLTHDGQAPSVAKDMELYERLVGGVPLHASPIEHQAIPDVLLDDVEGFSGWPQKHLHGNFVGWIQCRKVIELEMEQDARINRCAD
jgi:thymidylate synthase ThyX